jgi:hypothetical protein
MHKGWQWTTSGLLVIALCGCRDRPEPKPELAPLVPVGPNAPPDKPIHASPDETETIEHAIRPYVELALRSYPEAKRRYLAGLPRGERFQVVTKLARPGGFEVAFIEVTKIDRDQITGIIVTNLNPRASYKAGDYYVLPERNLFDWVIVHSDGTEEGNVVGKFLDQWQAQPQ